MQDAGIAANFIHGRRVTDQPTLEIVERVLAQETNEFLANEFEKIGGRAMTLNFGSTPVLFGEPLELKSDEGIPVDLGYVGHVTKVDRLVIDNLCYAGPGTLYSIHVHYRKWSKTQCERGHRRHGCGATVVCR